MRCGRSQAAMSKKNGTAEILLAQAGIKQQHTRLVTMVGHIVIDVTVVVRNEYFTLGSRQSLNSPDSEKQRRSPQQKQ